MIVVDANIVVYHVINGPMTAAVRRLLKIDPVWRSSKLWRYEITNAVATLYKSKIIDEATAVQALANADEVMSEGEEDVPQDMAMRAAIQYGVSAYDAQYITLAQMLGVKCVTCDARLARKTPGISMLLADADQLRKP